MEQWIGGRRPLMEDSEGGGRRATVSPGQSPSWTLVYGRKTLSHRKDSKSCNLRPQVKTHSQGTETDKCDPAGVQVQFRTEMFRYLLP